MIAKNKCNMFLFMIGGRHLDCFAKTPKAVFFQLLGANHSFHPYPSIFPTFFLKLPIDSAFTTCLSLVVLLKLLKVYSSSYSGPITAPFTVSFNIAFSVWQSCVLAEVLFERLVSSLKPVA